MNNWHPLTKILIGLGVLVVPYLLWTVPDDAPASVGPAAAVAAQQKNDATATPVVAATGDAGVPAEAAPLPEMGAFASMVERPLFNPARRRIAAPDAPEPEEAPAPVAPVVDFRLIGTISRDGDAMAIVGHGSETTTISLGDIVAGWRLHSVAPSEAVLVHDGQELRITLAPLR